jgi:hypothetical protein
MIFTGGMRVVNNGGPAFPRPLSTEGNYLADSQQGMTLRDWFATFAPEPTDDQVKWEAERDRAANPHNDNYKPARRSILEIRAELRYRYADAMIAAREPKPQ